MMTIVVDCRRFKTRAQAHEYLAGKPGFPAHYGKNLDALYDVLTSYVQPVRFLILHSPVLHLHLGAYGEGLLSVFRDAAKANESLTVEIK